MRIIAGKYRGRVIKAARTDRLRPTQDRVRAALFNIVGARITSASVLDLFSGSGALGIEALSRGASYVVFVESDKKSSGLIEDNLAALGCPQNFRVLCMDVLKSFNLLKQEGLKFDIAVMDPPYYKDTGKKILQEITKYDILTSQALVIVEHFKKDELPDEVGNLSRRRCASYGDTLLSFYEERR